MCSAFSVLSIVPNMKNFVQISTILVLFNKIEIWAKFSISQHQDVYVSRIIPVKVGIQLNVLNRLKVQWQLSSCLATVMFRGTPCTIKRIRVQILYVEPIAGVLYRIDLGNHWTSEHQVNPVHPKTATTFRHVNLPWKISHKFLKGPGLIYGLLYLRYLHVQWKCCKYYLVKYFLILLNTN